MHNICASMYGSSGKRSKPNLNAPNTSLPKPESVIASVLLNSAVLASADAVALPYFALHIRL
jgi:hypothetical protein